MMREKPAKTGSKRQHKAPVQPSTFNEGGDVAWGKAGHLRNRGFILLSIGLFVFVLAVFFPALHNDFLSWYGDDPLYVTENPHVNTGLTFENIGLAFTSTERSNWHPLTWISHMLDCQLYGLKPFGHHLTSVLFHAINAVLLFFLLRLMTGALWRSLLVVLLFAVHPLRVESVAWISERKDVLSVFFGLLTMIFYVAYAKNKRAGVPGLALNYAVALIFFACSLMSKGTLVTLPFVFFLLDFWPLKRFQERKIALVVEKIPFFLLTVAASSMVYQTQNKWSVLRTLDEYPFDMRLQNAVVSCGRYLGKMFLPIGLCGFYPYPERWPPAIVLTISILIVALTLVCFMQWRSRPYLIVGWLWYLGTLVPVIGLVQTCDQAMADRFTYIPMIGILFAFIWLADEFMRRWQQHQKTIYGIIAGALILPLAASTWRHIGHYKSGVTLWRRNLEVTGDNALARYALGLCLDQEGRHEEAIKELQEDLRVRPNHAEAQFNLGATFEKLGRGGEARDCYRKAVELQPGFLEARKNFGLCLANERRFDEAAAQFQEIIKRKPSADAYNDLAGVLGMGGHLDEAIENFRAALALDPNHAQAHGNLGGALGEKGLFDEAILHLREALRLNPNDAQARKDLDGILALKK